LDFVHYCKERKPREQRVLLVLDEFSALADAFEMDRMAEDLRSFNVSLVFVPQSLEGMGSEDQRLRLLKAARLKIIHRYEGAEALAALVGRALVPDFNLDLDDGVTAQRDRVSWVERWRMPPEEFLRLKPGEAIAIREGMASKVKAAAPPRLSPVSLPVSESLDRVYEWSRGGQKRAEGESESDSETAEGGVDAEVEESEAGPVEDEGKGQGSSQGVCVAPEAEEVGDEDDGDGGTVAGEAGCGPGREWESEV
jgi:hypothetical protein